LAKNKKLRKMEKADTQVNIQRIPVHSLSKIELEKELAELNFKRDLSILTNAEYRRITAIKIELGHRKYKFPRHSKAILFQGGTAGSTKK
jgi:hypothetical protein